MNEKPEIRRLVSNPPNRFERLQINWDEEGPPPVDFKVIEETFDSKNYFSSPESMDLAKKVYPTWEKQKEYMCESSKSKKEPVKEAVEVKKETNDNKTETKKSE